MNLNTPTIKPGPLTAADFNPKGLDYQGRVPTRDGDTPWPMLEDRRAPERRPPLTRLDLASIAAAWCAGAVVIGLAVFGLVTLIKLLPGA
tara:strand:+ start:368 stop:637 length:270 start_codon:yes stop_codon:yes gene_type:complete